MIPAEIAGSVGQCETRMQSEAEDAVDEHFLQREAEPLPVARQNI